MPCAFELEASTSCCTSGCGSEIVDEAALDGELAVVELHSTLIDWTKDIAPYTTLKI